MTRVGYKRECRRRLKADTPNASRSREIISIGRSDIRSQAGRNGPGKMPSGKALADSLKAFHEFVKGVFDHDSIDVRFNDDSGLRVRASCSPERLDGLTNVRGYEMVITAIQGKDLNAFILPMSKMIRAKYVPNSEFIAKRRACS